MREAPGLEPGSHARHSHLDHASIDPEQVLGAPVCPGCRASFPHGFAGGLVLALISRRRIFPGPGSEGKTVRGTVTRLSGAPLQFSRACPICIKRKGGNGQAWHKPGVVAGPGSDPGEKGCPIFPLILPYLGQSLSARQISLMYCHRSLRPPSRR